MYFSVIHKYALISFVLFMLGGCAEPLTEVDSCLNRDNMEVYCDFRNPEDIEPLPDNKYLVISEYADPAASVKELGGIVLFNMESKTRRPATLELGQHSWGDLTCRVPSLSELQPHGISLDTSGGYLRLLVVNHSEVQDNVEMFEVRSTEEGWRFVWRGSICPPDRSYLNDVTTSPDGRIYTTRMYDKSLNDGGVINQVRLLAAVMLKLNTGWVWEWHQDSGYTFMLNSEGGMPNGITAIAKDNTVLANYSSQGQLVRFDARTGKVLGNIAVPTPDNSSFDGTHLWVASNDASLADFLLCAEIKKGPCLLPFSIYRIDPATIKGETTLDKIGAKVVRVQHRNQPPYGAATVAVSAAGKLWLGTFSGDRIGAIALNADDR